MTVSYPPVEDVWFLTGPTASAKSEVGVCLAQMIGAEVISLDSMAVYRGMDIGTAKPHGELRRRAPHHLIDIVEPTQEFSVADYLQAAHSCVAAIKKRSRRVLFVGGTPLYLKGLLSGLTSGPEADWQLRETLQAAAEAHGPQHLHDRLNKIDPEAAAKLHPHDTRRLIRAIEVFEKTGQGISEIQTQFDRPVSGGAVQVLVMDWPRPILHERINARVDAMFDKGLVEEVRELLGEHGALGRTAAQAVGYREVLALLRGDLELNSAVERTKAASRQLARRQLIWFRGLASCRWIAMSEPVNPQQTARDILAAAGPSGRDPYRT